MQTLLRLFFIALLGFTAKPLWADAVEISTEMHGLVIGPSLRFIEDAQRQMTSEDIFALDPKAWKSSPQQNPNFGFTRSAYWARFQMKNPYATTQRIFLEYGYANADYIDFHMPNEKGEYSWKRSGDQMPITVREISYRLPVFVVDVPPGIHTYFMRIETEGVVQFPLRVWTPEAFHSKRASESAFLGTVYGFFLVMVFYNLLLGLSVRSASSLLYVGFILAGAGNFFGYQGLWLVLFPDSISPLLANQGFIISSGFFASFGAMFTYSFLNLKEHPRFIRWMIYLGGAIGIFVVLLCPFSYNLSAKISTANAFVTAFAILAAAGLACYRRFRPAYFFTFAWLLSIVGNMLNPLALASLIPVNMFTLWGPFLGVAAEVVLISLALGDKMRLAQEESEQQIRELNADLERKVEEKTRDIMAIMKNIKLGIFAIQKESFAIHKDYSQHLEDMLHQTQLHNRPALPLLFQNSTLSNDEQQQAKSALDSSLGEDEIAFETNAHCLPRELHYKAPHAEQTFELDWNPMTNPKGEVERVLVTCKDVTEIRRYQKEAEHRQKELNYIAELINISQEKFSKFSASAHHFLEENKRLLNASAQSGDVLKILFINMHTVKGAARSLGLKELTNSVHEAENTLTSLQKGEGTWDRERMLRELEAVAQSLAQYDWISTNRLNRSLHTMDSIEVRIEDLEKEVQAIEELQANVDHKTMNSYLTTMKRRMARYAFRPAADVFRELCEPAPRLAKDLGKLAPRIHIEASDICFTHRSVELLRNVFVHILRNALDHGIETESERRMSGKAPQGTIAVSMKVEADRKLSLCIRDDGRGLAIGMIREIGIIKGFISSDQAPGADALAQLIFESGFSTSAGVNEISGRGVGMDAVKRILEKEGAAVNIELDKTNVPVGSEFIPFYLHITLPVSLYRRVEAEQNLAMVS
ncbi:MAG TPA: 7TM diverse intracellular signaling domain-containing protein [Oligoflexus sp.]|uniref:7TM diverse intracellular signaling domain-containing protein n=1 Tax=Oligoflexus sp. TaxID=1971216 RepID=UPI002D7E93BB|nr:7TM diverse intracellular signaling domain-containing protein [Oligoflexus sp.]HET9238552.1 7TM diverse intracellular signaling domain-containing protein [Oligoflexus sp.]